MMDNSWYNHTASTSFDVYWIHSATDMRHTGVIAPNGGALGQQTYNDHRWIVKLKDISESCVWTGTSAIGTLNITIKDTLMPGIFDVVSVEETPATETPAAAGAATPTSTPTAATVVTAPVTSPPVVAGAASVEIKTSGRFQLSEALRDCADNISTKIYHRHIINITHTPTKVSYPFTFNIEQGVEHNHKQLFATLREDAKFVVDHIPADILPIITKIPFW
jgi:hypothetical protein